MTVEQFGRLWPEMRLVVLKVYRKRFSFMSEEDKEDLLQCIALRAISGLPNYDESKCGWSSWIMWEAKSVFSNRTRKLTARMRDGSTVPLLRSDGRAYDVSDDRYNPYDLAVADVLTTAISEAIDKLTPRQRSVVMMRANGATYTEIGNRMGCSAMACRNSRYHAIQRLKRLVSCENEHNGCIQLP